MIWHLIKSYIITKREEIWWDDNRVDQTFTSELLQSKLSTEGFERLDAKIRTGLTYSYNRCPWRRLFLILVELGAPEKIFGLLDEYWEDSDFPLSIDKIKSLGLDRRFHERQFYYWPKWIDVNRTVRYLDEEKVPIDVISTGPKSKPDVVQLPNTGETFVRWHIPVCKSGYEDFEHGIKRINDISHRNIVRCSASYISQGYGYILFQCEHNLGEFLRNTPADFKILAIEEKKKIIIQWISDLVNALAALHKEQVPHGRITPTSIFIGSGRSIFLSNPIIDRKFPIKLSDTQSSYDYAAAEQYFLPGVRVKSIQADVFSLGCVILELLAFLFDRDLALFTDSWSARSARRKRHRGAPRDSSYHQNLEAVERWVRSLINETPGVSSDQKVMGRITLMGKMLAGTPKLRPSIEQVQQELRNVDIVVEGCGRLPVV
jgi:serine/threonine protein kinase